MVIGTIFFTNFLQPGVEFVAYPFQQEFEDVHFGTFHKVSLLYFYNATR